MDTTPITDKRVDTTTRNSMVARVEVMGEEVMGEEVMEVVSDKKRMVKADT